jgi:hypothetical protein
MRRSLILPVALAAVLAVATGAAGGGAPSPARVGVPLSPLAGSQARGLAYFELKGQTLRYWVVVFGLEPGSEHAAHIHGPRGACAPAARNVGVAVGVPDLKADANGVAYLAGSVSLRTAAIKNVLRRGFYFNVHAYPTAELQSKGLAALACGNIR